MESRNLAQAQSVQVGAQRAELLNKLSTLIATADGSSYLHASDEEAKAPIKKRALRLLDARARSRHELRQRLSENKEFPVASHRGSPR